MNCSRFEESAARRQRILDFLHERPRSTYREIIAAVSASGEESLTENCIASMLRMGEISRAEGSVHGKSRYVAAVHTTVSAERMREINLAAVMKAREKLHSAQKQGLAEITQERGLTAAARYVHRCGNLPPIQNQRGQGAARLPGGVRPHGGD